MQILTYWAGDGLRLGVRVPGGVLDVAAAARSGGSEDGLLTPDAFFRKGLEALPALQRLITDAAGDTSGSLQLLDESTLKLGPSVPHPGKVLCVGLNYRRHAKESGLEAPEEPLLFSKFNNSVTSTHARVEIPEAATQVDYEAELVVVIGRKAKGVPVREALEYVLGYTCGNDLSARDLQMKSSQWLLGKSLDGFMPLGPFVMTGDEIEDPQDLPIRSWLNGELRQNSNTQDMIFGVAEIIAYASSFMTLEPGDVIATGTPEGVILGMRDKVWLAAGDEVTVEVGPLGRLVTTFTGP